MKRVPFLGFGVALLVMSLAVPAAAEPPKGDDGCRGQSTLINESDPNWIGSVDENFDGSICWTLGNNGTVTLKDNTIQRKR